MKKSSMLLISFLSLYGCFGRTVPTVRDTKQYVIKYKMIEIVGGQKVVDPMSVRCAERDYRFSEDKIGGVSDAVLVDVEKCNGLTGWTSDYPEVAGFWERLRVYLGKIKQSLKDKGIK